MLYLRLRTLQTQPLGGESHSLLPEDQRKGDSLHQVLERLGARLGREQLLCVQPQAGHQPERMQDARHPEENAQQDIEQSGLAAPRRPDNAQEIAFADVEIDRRQGLHSRAASAKVAKKTAETGVNPGTIRGIGRADRLATLIPPAYGRKSGVR